MIVGQGTLSVPSMPRINKVMMVVGLKANLLSVGQICDSDYNVTFQKNTCNVLNKTGDCIMTSDRYSNKCYLVRIGKGSQSPSLCLIIK